MIRINERLKEVKIQKRLIDATRPARYAIDSASYRLMCDKNALKELKDVYHRRPLLVVGNGPSLNKTPLDKFANTPSIGMNKIDLIYPKTSWRPNLIVCLNTLVAQQHQAHFATSPVPVFVSWKSRPLIKKENRPALKFFNTLYSGNFSVDALTGFGSSATVTYIALQMAYWMGASPVILLGVDHNFSYSGPEATYQKRTGPDTNHFDPNYFSHGTYWGTPDLVRSENDYQAARVAFERDRRKVLDATIGGKLKIFEKITLTEALELVND